MSELMWLMIGACLGVLVMALCVAAARGDQ